VQDGSHDARTSFDLLGRPLRDNERADCVAAASFALRSASADERAEIRAGSGCDVVGADGDCSAPSLASRLCVSLAGTSKMLFRGRRFQQGNPS
jgi:hypothetical protein